MDVAQVAALGIYLVDFAAACGAGLELESAIATGGINISV